jgi:nanoRNase/pAp phosphatase (c-di-AMP/oligoRNAs hydrolase)
MFTKELTENFKQDLNQAKTILVLLPSEPDEVLVTSGLSLFLSLKSLGKKVQIGCSSLDQTNLAQIPGLDNIKSSIGAQNLIINFKFKEESLDKVDYDVDDQGNFQLMIKPKTGVQPPDSKDIAYTYSGAKADMVITLGINSLEELGKLYSDEKKFLDRSSLVSLHKDSRPATFATHNFHTNSASSIAEIVAFLLLKTSTKPTKEAANSLLKEIYGSTNNLQSPRVTANTFEIIAFLLRNGAKPTALSHVSNNFAPPVSPLPIAPVFNQPQSLSQIPPAPVPSDWKKPKIFRSTPSR